MYRVPLDYDVRNAAVNCIGGLLVVSLRGCRARAEARPPGDYQ